MVDFAGFSREFLGQIFVEKQTRKQKRNIADKNVGRMPNSGQERKTKVHSTQFWRQLYLFRATRKTNKALPKRLASKPPFSAAISSRKQQCIKLLSLHCSLVLLCSLQARLFYNLGQNKKEQLTPIPPKRWWRGKGAKTRNFGIIEMGGGVVQMFHLFCPRL